MNQKDLMRDSTLDLILSRVLMWGMILAIVTTVIGGVLLLRQQGTDIVNHSIFKGEPADLTHVSTIILEAFRGDALSIIQLGLLLMIITPVARILSCLIIFAYQRDRLYVVLSGFVFAVLVFSLIR